MKKIWFDLSNAPHINMFEQLIKELENEGVKVVITCRPLSNTVDLLNLHGFKYTIVGVHYGKNIFRKLFGFPIRVYQLYKFLRNQRVDVAISQSSFHSPLVSFLLNIPSIYMNDNEHAIGNIPSFIFASKILLPEFFDIKKAQKQLARKSKIIQYPGVKEGIYLWNTKLINNQHPKNIYLRPEPWLAQYYKGSSKFLDDLIIELKPHYNIIILPRGENQAVHYRKDLFLGVTVQDKVLGLLEIANDCLLFIGAGGTMTREMAVLGIPTISIYQNELLDVDRFLVSSNKMVHLPHLNIDKVTDFIESRIDGHLDIELANKGKRAYNLIKEVILGL